jgi:hypothetical protein
MPAKKAVKEVLTEEQVNDEIVKATLREAALKAAYLRRMEDVAQCRAEEMELRESFRLLESAFGDARGERFDIISDFTRQHKATEDELIARCTVLDNTITDLKDQQELSKLALTETQKERDHYIAMKDREHEEQARKMKEMEEEFTVMLRDTQHKMTERVESTMPDNADEEEDEVDGAIEEEPSS